MNRGDVTFSVIIPTRGRASLTRTLASVADQQLAPGDEILVLCSDDDDYGNRARQSLIERARGSHLIFMDDDDQYARGAFVTMRRFAREHPARIGIFRMRQLDGRTRWVEPELRRGNVSSQMFCVPNLPQQLGTWVLECNESPELREYVRDFLFLSQTIELQDAPIFCSDVIAHNRADRRPAIRAGQLVVHNGRALSRRVRSGFRSASAMS